MKITLWDPCGGHGDGCGRMEILTEEDGYVGRLSRREVEVDEATLSRWQQTIQDYHAMQEEMRQVMAGVTGQAEQAPEAEAGYKAARGIIPRPEGAEKPEVIIRRMRDNW
jgi:hypothetical protein